MDTPAVKICGITCDSDAKLAVNLGASYLGFILYEKSPRALFLDSYLELAESLPDVPRVVVDVNPDYKKVKSYLEAGFDYFQFHFNDLESDDHISEWSDMVGPERLWLAPKMPDSELFPESLFQYADTFLIDTYVKDGYGGSGQVGNWERFSQLKNDYPEKKWILAGGLRPENIVSALAETTPEIVDASSGVESSPGIKDADLMIEFFDHLKL